MDEWSQRPLLSRPLRREQLVWLDVAAAVGYTVVVLVLPGVGSDLPVWARLLIVAGMGLPLAVRRRWPRSVFAVVLAVSIAATVLDVVRDYFLAAAYALYMVALAAPPRWLSPRTVAGISVAGVLLFCTAGTPYSWRRQAALILGGAVVLGVTWTIGRLVGEGRAHAALAAEQLAERAVAEERLRIARELHDVVAHGMGVIAVKAGVANHVAETQPDEARKAMRVIETVSREALVEMRHLLGVLRWTADPADPAADSPRRPTPGVASLGELVDRAAQAGVRVELVVRGADGLPEGMGLSAYRIVQEALTNVVRHAAPASCRVEVIADETAVRIEVTDDGPGSRVLPPPAIGGHGLIGMRERVMMYGGTFTAGPRPTGGFAVTACLPLAGAGRDA